MIASEVEEALSDVKWFMRNFERMYQTHIQTPHVQAVVPFIEAVRATTIGKHNRVRFFDGHLSVTFGDFNLTLIAEVD